MPSIDGNYGCAGLCAVPGQRGADSATGTGNQHDRVVEMIRG